MFDRVMSIPRVLSMLGTEYTKGLRMCQANTGFYVNCILKIHGILNVLSSEYAKWKFWMYQESKYVFVAKGFE